MSEAFARDPLFLHLFGDSELDEKAKNSMVAFVSFMFDKSFLPNEEAWGIFESDNLLGTYLIEKPSVSKLQNIKGTLFTVLYLIRLIPKISEKALSLLNTYMRITRPASPSLTHHYLIMIGVKPEVQGKGVGKSLLLHLLNKINMSDTSQGVALDTENIENVNLYQRFGFILKRETQINHVPVYCMFYQKK
ncbi:N-acetyltransferase [Paenibacillus sp. L3-i20]|uniref:GNAT family N-acetyltransferase n=1 Tax=Paenibacillus sp. L3-i20 TaxID=2905833 RepID=UPI001EDEC1E4|nr:GNAT family N-acetyltransferase [Paenibacillus sp. L3-i20]